MRNREDQLFQRYEGNPLLTSADWPYPCHSVFNPGAARLADGTTVLLCRVEDHRGHSHLTAARSADGLTGWTIDAAPTLLPGQEDAWGIEDPRVTFLAERQQYAAAFTSYTTGGPAVSLALTDDFRRFERVGLILPPENKDAALFPRRIGEDWVLIHRPVSVLGGTNLWIGASPDLVHWGAHRPLFGPRPGGWWDNGRVGLATPPIETPAGWLLLYHGSRHTYAGCLYRLGLCLTDLDEPHRILARGDQWVFGPDAPCERTGDVNNVVFPCGYTLADDGDTLRMYYGAADTCVCLATARVSELLGWLQNT